MTTEPIAGTGTGEQKERSPVSSLPALDLPATPTVRDLLIAATAQLQTAGSDSPRLDAEVLLRHLLGWDRVQFLVALPEALPPAILEPYTLLLAQRAAGMPVAYLIGAREFMGQAFVVGPGVLVPRPETECLVEWLAAQVQAESAWAKGVRVVDVGTGSGAIALSLAALLPTACVVGVERSAQALAYARQNRARADLATRVALVQGDLLAPIGAVDVIAANLLYLRLDQLHAGIAAEPVEALVSGDDGLDLYRALLPQAAQVLQRPGLFAAEVDPSQAIAMQALCAAAFPQGVIRVQRDLAGRERFVTVVQR